jgi:ribulose bisphosphate carboxylase small subunit
MAINEVFTYGGIVYDVGNWKSDGGFDWSRLGESLERHLMEWKSGRNYDVDSGLYVLAHLGCCNAMLLEHFITLYGHDDRGKAQIISASISNIKTDMDPAVIARAQAKREANTKKGSGE